MKIPELENKFIKFKKGDLIQPQGYIIWLLFPEGHSMYAHARWNTLKWIILSPSIHKNIKYRVTHYMKPKCPLAISVNTACKEFGLSGRSHNILFGAYFAVYPHGNSWWMKDETVQCLKRFRNYDFSTIRNCGKKSVEEIVSFLEYCNYEFGLHIDLFNAK